MDFFGIGTPELILILLIFFIFLGPSSKLPEIARKIGKVTREFKRTSAEMNRNLREMSEGIKSETDKQTESRTSGETGLARDLKGISEDVHDMAKGVNAVVGPTSGMTKDVGGPSDPRKDSPQPHLDG